MIVTACACHDFHNSFEWGMPTAFADAEMIWDCYIGVEASRNSTDVVIAYLGVRVSSVLVPGVSLGLWPKRSNGKVFGPSWMSRQTS